MTAPGGPAGLPHRCSPCVVLVVIYVPLVLVLLNSFNTDRTFGWPPPGYTLQWWELRLAEPGRPRRAAGPSVKVALCATAIALVLGTLAAMALRRTRFFGRNVVSLLIILPIALPGIVTGLALQNGFRTILGIQLSIWTIVIAHATFCIVTVFNNVAGPLPAARRQPRAGLDGPRRRTVHDVPAGDPADAALGAAGRGAAGVRAVLRRDRGDHVHRERPGPDAADLDLPEPVPAQPGARSSTAWPPRWCCSRRSRSTSPSGCPATPPRR